MYVFVSPSANGSELQHQETPPYQQHQRRHTGSYLSTWYTNHTQTPRECTDTRETVPSAAARNPLTLRSGQRSSATLEDRKSPQTSTRESTVSRACSRTALLDDSDDDTPPNKPPFASAAAQQQSVRARDERPVGQTRGGIIVVLFRSIVEGVRTSREASKSLRQATVLETLRTWSHIPPTWEWVLPTGHDPTLCI